MAMGAAIAGGAIGAEVRARADGIGIPPIIPPGAGGGPPKPIGGPMGGDGMAGAAA